MNVTVTQPNSSPRSRVRSRTSLVKLIIIKRHISISSIAYHKEQEIMFSKSVSTRLQFSHLPSPCICCINVILSI